MTTAEEILESAGSGDEEAHAILADLVHKARTPSFAAVVAHTWGEDIGRIELSDDVVAALIEDALREVQDKWTDTRSRTVWMLGKAGVPEAFPVLIDLAQRLLRDERRDLLYQVLCSMPLCASGSSIDDAQMDAVFAAATRAADAGVRALAENWLATGGGAP